MDEIKFEYLCFIRCFMWCFLNFFRETETAHIFWLGALRWPFLLGNRTRSFATPPIQKYNKNWGNSSSKPYNQTTIEHLRESLETRFVGAEIVENTLFLRPKHDDNFIFIDHLLTCRGENSLKSSWLLKAINNVFKTSKQHQINFAIYLWPRKWSP